MPHQHHLGAVVHHVGGGHLLGPHRTRIVAAHRFGVATIEHREAQRRIDPAIVFRVELPSGIERDVRHELGIHGQSGRQHHAAGFGDLAQAIQLGPGTFRVHMIGGDGGDPTPVVDAGIQQRAEIVAQIGRSLQVNLRRKHDACGGDGPQEFLGGTRRLVLHAGARLGQEVLHDHFLHVSVASMRFRDRFEGRQTIGASLAESDEDARGERDAELSGIFERGQSTSRILVGRTAMTGQVIAQRFDHHALAR